MAAVTSNSHSLEALKPLVGEWRMAVSFKDMPPTNAGARVTWSFSSCRSFEA